METNCSPNYDSILKKAKWLIIVAYVCPICQLIINLLGANKLCEEPAYYFLINIMFNCTWIFLSLSAFLKLRKYPNNALKRSANIILFLITLYIIYFISEVLCPIYFYNFIGNPISNIPFIYVSIPLTYLYVTAYVILLKDKNIKTNYILPIYSLCLGEIILIFSNMTPMIFSMIYDEIILDSTKEFNLVHNFIKVILNLIGYILIIQGWKCMLSTPSKIPIVSTSKPISLKPTKIEYGYLISCCILTTLLFIYFNSVSFDIFTK